MQERIRDETYHGEILVGHVVVDSNPSCRARKDMKRWARGCAVNDNTLASLAARVDLCSCDSESLIWCKGFIVKLHGSQGNGWKPAPQHQG